VCPQHLGGTLDIDSPLPVTVDGYDMWEIQALLAMCTDNRTRDKQALGLRVSVWDPVANLPKSVLNGYYVLQKQTGAIFSEQEDDSDTF
jgi:hypothetical protein